VIQATAQNNTSFPAKCAAKALACQLKEGSINEQSLGE